MVVEVLSWGGGGGKGGTKVLRGDKSIWGCKNVVSINYGTFVPEL